MMKVFKDVLCHERGFVLVASLLILTLLMAAGVGAIFSMQTDLKSSGNFKTGRQAFYIADAGISRAWQELSNADGISDFETLLAAGTVALYTNEAFAGGSYSVLAEPLPGSEPKRVKVTSIGCFPAGNPCPSGHSKAVIEAHLGRRSLFPCVICSTEGLSLSAGATTDSYDSRLGPYGLEEAGNKGHLHSSGNISLSGGTTIVKGNVAAGQSVAITGGAAVTGTVTENAGSDAVSPAAACGPPYHDGKGISGGVYNPLTGELRASGTDAIILDAGNYCFSHVDLAEASTLMVNGPVRVYVTSHGNFTGSGIVNTTAQAENFMIISSLSSSDQGLSIASGSMAYMTVYAPRAKVTILGNGDLFGAVVARSIINTSAVRLHYDQKLSDNQEGRVGLLLWKEVL